jgi:hypothetical protein
MTQIIKRIISSTLHQFGNNEWQLPPAIARVGDESVVIGGPDSLPLVGETDINDIHSWF